MVHDCCNATVSVPKRLKLAYEPPALRWFGHMSELTASGSRAGVESAPFTCENQTSSPFPCN